MLTNSIISPFLCLGDTASNYLRERHPVKRNNLNQGGGDVFTPNQGFSHFNNDIQRGGIMGINNNQL